MTNPIYITGESCSSFELRKLSKGFAWTIKIYDPDIMRGYNSTKEINDKASEDFGTVNEEE